MKTEIKTPTIAELWKELSKADYMERFKSDLVGCDHDWLVEKVQSLRQQLVERCEKVWDAAGVYTQFSIYTERCVINPRTFVQSMGGSRFDTPETAANYIGAYAFWAWELEQREKEMEAQP